MNHPNLHFQMNGAWILSKDTEPTKIAVTGERKTYEQKDTVGKIQGRWQAVKDASAGYVLDGAEAWRSAEGELVWQWERSANGDGVWTQRRRMGSRAGGMRRGRWLGR